MGCSMAEFDRLTRCSPWINLAFVERERTPKPAIERSIRLHLARLLLSTISSILLRLSNKLWLRAAMFSFASLTRTERARSGRWGSGRWVSSYQIVFCLWDSSESDRRQGAGPDCCSTSSRTLCLRWRIRRVHVPIRTISRRSGRARIPRCSGRRFRRRVSCWM